MFDGVINDLNYLSPPEIYPQSVCSVAPAEIVSLSTENLTTVP